MQPVKEVSHIGIAVEKIEKHLPFYEKALGLKVEKIEKVESEQVRVAFLSVGNTKFELLEPTSSQSVIQKFLDRHGEGIHHIALEVNDLQVRLEEMQKKGFQSMNNKPLPGALDSIRSFIHPKTSGGVLFELTEDQKKNDNF